MPTIKTTRKPVELSPYQTRPTLTLDELNELARLEGPNRPAPGEKLTGNHFREIRDLRYWYMAIVWSENQPGLDGVRNLIKQQVPEDHKDRPLLSEAVRAKRAELIRVEQEKASNEETV